MPFGSSAHIGVRFASILTKSQQKILVSKSGSSLNALAKFMEKFFKKLLTKGYR